MRQQLAAVGDLSVWMLFVPAVLLALVAVAAAALPPGAGSAAPAELLRRP